MLNRAISIVLVLVLLPQFTGCTSVKAFNFTDVEPGSQQIYGVIAVTSQQVDSDEPSTDAHNDLLYATVDQNRSATAVDQVEQLEVPDEIMPILVIVGALGVLMLIGLALWSG